MVTYLSATVTYGYLSVSPLVCFRYDYPPFYARARETAGPGRMSPNVVPACTGNRMRLAGVRTRARKKMRVVTGAHSRALKRDPAGRAPHRALKRAWQELVLMIEISIGGLHPVRLRAPIAPANESPHTLTVCIAVRRRWRRAGRRAGGASNGRPRRGTGRGGRAMGCAGEGCSGSAQWARRARV